MSTSPAQITVPKTFFVAERNKFYSSWPDALWREFFQNSVDARSKTIRITLRDEAAKGSFGREPGLDRVTRMVFEDDGVGMTEDILNNVFFALGESTKRDEDSQVGGFGRARIMQAFSQVRYAIRTRDRAVEGDGPSYTNLAPAQAATALESWAEAMLARAAEHEAKADWGMGSRLRLAADAHRRDAAALREGPLDLRGCRFEVDLDPTDGDGYYNRPTVERMREALDEYLAASEIKCKVFLNGEEIPVAKRRMDKRKRLAVTMDADKVPQAFLKGKVEILDRADGKKDVVFGTLHEIKPDEARYPEKGQINVRVRGASMFKTSAHSSNHALVLELDPAVAREVLTSNRDALRSPYQEAVSEFTRMMATDANKALDGREDEEFTLLQGGKGQRIRHRATPDFSAEAKAPESAPERLRLLEKEATATTRYVTHRGYEWSAVVRNGLDGVPFPDLMEFLTSLKGESGGASFLSTFPDQAKAAGFRETLQRQGENQALAYGSGELLGFICNHLKYRRALADHTAASEYKDKMSDLHDIPILRKDLAPPPDQYEEGERKKRRSSLMKAMRRYDPRNWDRETGKGRTPHMLLVAWSVAVDNYVDMLLEAFPKIKPFPYSTGWTFSHKQFRHNPALGERSWINTEAKYLRPDRKQEICHFLLNPLDDESFELRFDPRDEDDRARILAVALHEVAHRLSEDHDEAFAMAQTELRRRETPSRLKAIYKEMDMAMKAVTKLYGKGRTKVQPMDDEPGARPSERLLGALAGKGLERQPDGTLVLEEGRIAAADAAMLEDMALAAEPEPAPAMGM